MFISKLCAVKFVLVLLVVQICRANVSSDDIGWGDDGGEPDMKGSDIMSNLMANPDQSTPKPAHVSAVAPKAMKDLHKSSSAGCPPNEERPSCEPCMQTCNDKRYHKWCMTR